MQRYYKIRNMGTLFCLEALISIVGNGLGYENVGDCEAQIYNL